MRKLKMHELNRMDVADFKSAPKVPVIIILDNIRSQHNIGAVFRTCDAFRIEKMYLCGITACPPHREIQRTALDATESVDWEYHNSAVSLISDLKKLNFLIIAVELTDKSIPLQNFIPDFSKKTALIFGNEVLGIDDEILPLCDHCIEIPQYGTKHSLNISVSAGIVIWDFFKKHIKNNENNIIK